MSDKWRGEIDRLLAERRPNRYEPEGGDEWLDEVADAVVSLRTAARKLWPVPDADVILTMGAAAELVGLDSESYIRLADEGVLPCVKLAGRRIVHRDVLVERIAELSRESIAVTHTSPERGVCMIEAAAWIAGEPFTDHPECVSPVIAAFCRSWNDALGDEDRQQLKELIPVVIGTGPATDQAEDARAWMALDWLVRVHTPAWLRLAGLTEQADRLAALAEFRAGMDVPAVRPTIEAVRSDAAAARAAAWDAARAAARDAARAAAWDAARDALRPTVMELQASARDLVRRMAAVS